MFRTKLLYLPRVFPSAPSSPDPTRLITSCLPDPVQNPTRSESDPTPPQSPTRRASTQLSRWSRARSLRSGRRLSWPALREKSESSGSLTITPKSPSSDSSTSSSSGGVMKEQIDEMDGQDEFGEMANQGKQIYMVSDGTGWTAEHSVNAALGQFEHCLVDRGCPVNTHLFSGVEDTDRLLEIIKQAAKEGALVLYTLADPNMADAAKKACQLWEVPATDILSPTTEAIAAHLGVAPSGIPRGVRKAPLSEDYFQRIEAIDFTIKQDDGAMPQNLNRAHIVLVGVSRTGKTPLSIYLAQKGYKVANVPIVMGVELPKSLFEINQEKIFGLTINSTVLQAIRKARAKALGFHGGMRSNYSEMDHVKSELEYAHKIFAQNPSWPVIEVTGKAIEETAAVIVRIYHDKKQKCSMPRISKRY